MHKPVSGGYMLLPLQGIRATHSDFITNGQSRVRAGYSFDGSDSLSDQMGYGTQVAGEGPAKAGYTPDPAACAAVCTSPLLHVPPP